MLRTLERLGWLPSAIVSHLGACQGPLPIEQDSKEEGGEEVKMRDGETRTSKAMLWATILMLVIVLWNSPHNPTVHPRPVLLASTSIVWQVCQKQKLRINRSDPSPP